MVNMLNSKRQKQILKTMGIPVWTAHRDIPGQKRDEDELGIMPDIASVNISDLSSDTAHKYIPENASDKLMATNPLVSGDDWQLLQKSADSCTACELHQSRTNSVFGVGNIQARLMVIGEAPDEEGGLQGEPFVGLAGQLLDRMLFSLGFSRDEVFITNTVKCSPPNDRKPTKDEIGACAEFLCQQINYIKPDVILCIGAASAKSLLHSNETIGNLRGQLRIHEESSIPLIATYHPAYLLRKPTEKRAVWDDLLLVKRLLMNKQSFENL